MFTLQLATVLGPTSYQLYNFGNATSEHCLQQTTVSIEHAVRPKRTPASGARQCPH